MIYANQFCPYMITNSFHFYNKLKILIFCKFDFFEKNKKLEITQFCKLKKINAFFKNYNFKFRNYNK